MNEADDRTARAFAPVDAARFRAIMRGPVSPVVVVATGEAGQRAGCTVTSVCSLSDAPPSVLVCLNSRSAAREAVVRNGRFTVNYLSSGQQEDADLLAGRLDAQGDDKFHAQHWRAGPMGLPCLANAMAVLVCEVASVAEFGSHSIVCGAIGLAATDREAVPLLYGRGRYMAIPAGGRDETASPFPAGISPA